MGCLWASHLHHAFQQTSEHSVQFLSTRDKTHRHIQFSLSSPFLSVEQQHFNINLPVSKPSDIKPATQTQPNIILLCTKSYQALEAALKLQPFLNAHCYLILFQNGLGSQHKILEGLQDIAIYAAVSTEGVNRQADGNLIHAGKGLTRIGPLNEAARQQLKFNKCLEALTHNGIQTQANDNIWPALWEKLAINCAINPFTAILDCPNGEIKNTRLFQEKWPALKSELSAMLNQAGVTISSQELEARVFKVIENTRNNISSMLQDVRAKRQTEIEDINGFAARYLAENGLSNTVNQNLLMAVLEQKGKL